MTIEKETLEKLIRLRHDIHKHPDLSNKEKETANRIKDFLQEYKPDKIIEEIGGYGMAAIFEGEREGPVIAFRTELDGLPIEEINDMEYRSVKKMVSHKCGHDGHMTIVSGLAPLIAGKKLKQGKVILLYQPAEETGEGAERMLKDPGMKEIRPDYIFALHNIPGEPKGTVLLKEGPFAAASEGMIIKLKGSTSHAAEPEKGRSPALCMADIMQAFNQLPLAKDAFRGRAFATIIHAVLGEIAFGTSPGYGEVRATLRTFRDGDMETLTRQAETIVKDLADSHKLEYEISWTEEFPATINHPEAVEILKNAVKNAGVTLNEQTEPNGWSEDFGHFTKQFKGAQFGLGSGEDQPSLHNPDFDFPDDIIETGVSVFYHALKEVLNEKI